MVARNKNTKKPGNGKLGSSSKPASGKLGISSKPSNGKSRKGLSGKDIEHFKDLLLSKRKELILSVNEFENEALGKSRQESSGDLSTMPVHMADLASDIFEQEFSIGLLDGERRILHEIDDALGRIQEGTYGVCEGTREFISKARLEAQPWARYCVEYARIMEQR